MPASPAEALADALATIVRQAVTDAAARLSEDRALHVSGTALPGALTGEEAATYLAIGQSTLKRLAMEGNIPSLTIGRRRVYRRVALDAWLANREDDAT